MSPTPTTPPIPTDTLESGVTEGGFPPLHLEGS